MWQDYELRIIEIMSCKQSEYACSGSKCCDVLCLVIHWKCNLKKMNLSLLIFYLSAFGYLLSHVIKIFSCVYDRISNDSMKEASLFCPQSCVFIPWRGLICNRQVSIFRMICRCLTLKSTILWECVQLCILFAFK